MLFYFRNLLVLGFIIFPLVNHAQFFSGYYTSQPQVEGFDHFKIKHHSEHEGKYEGIFSMKAYFDKEMIWERKAETIHGEEASLMIRNYGENKEILSVHKLRMLWDGIEWDFYFLGYLDNHDHGRFIVVEEVYNDGDEIDLIAVKRYHWSKGHHFTEELELADNLNE